MKRQIDELGRVVVPKDVRKALNIRPRDYLEITLEEDRFIIRKAEETCVFCGKTENLVMLSDKFVCPACIAALREAN